MSFLHRHSGSFMPPHKLAISRYTTMIIIPHIMAFALKALHFYSLRITPACFLNPSD